MAVVLLMELPYALSTLLNDNFFSFFLPKPYVSVYRPIVIKVLFLTKLSFKRWVKDLVRVMGETMFS